MLSGLQSTALLLQMGLRVGEACSVDVTDISQEQGYDVLTSTRKGNKVTRKALPIPVMRAVHVVIAGRTEGPILRNRRGDRMDRKAVARAVNRIAAQAGITHPITPHGLRRSAATFAREMGMSVDQIQELLNHAQPSTTMLYLRATGLDRQAAHQVAAAMAGLAR